jgi:hypothetical protein
MGLAYSNEMTPAERIKSHILALKEWSSEKHGRGTFLARHFGISKQLLADWFAGRALPSWEKGIEIEQFLKAQKPQKPASKT